MRVCLPLMITVLLMAIVESEQIGQVSETKQLGWSNALGVAKAVSRFKSKLAPDIQPVSVYDKKLSNNDRRRAATVLPYAILARHITRVETLPTALGLPTGLCSIYQLKGSYKSEKYKTVFAKYESRREVVFVFKGTTEMREWRKINIMFIPTSCPFTETKASTTCGKIHGGFVTAFIDMKKALDRMLEKVPENKNIVTAGHSLGGAMAVLAAAYMVTKGRAVKGVYTFGAPRVGDDEFAQYFKKIAPKTRVIRVVHNNGKHDDLVTEQLQSRYQHVKAETVRLRCQDGKNVDCSLRDMHHFFYYITSLVRVASRVCGAIPKNSDERTNIKPSFFQPPFVDQKAEVTE
eukprot:Partr_v1_DN24284_c0_g1_i1_m36812 putative Lipase class 3 family protein